MILWTIAIGSLIAAWLFKLNKDYSVMGFFARRIKTTDGSPLEAIAPVAKGRTIFANTFDLIGMNNVESFSLMRNVATELNKNYIEYILGVTVYNIIDAEAAELVFNDPSLIKKGLLYDFLHPFLRTGLLTSTDKKWHSRRKLLTPTFHFNILAQFEEIFKHESEKFVKNLETQNLENLSLSELIPKFTLNSVCETALGVQLDECLDGDKYRKSFKMIEECFVIRMANPLYMNETLFYYFVGAAYKPHLKTVHEFSSGIIEKRRQLFAEELKKGNDVKKADDDDLDFMSKKKRYAMLDTLLRSEKEGHIDHIGICEEVDTFMFEGFDTTSMGLIFGLMNLSLYPEMQERCYQEIIDNIDDDFSTLDISQLNKLKYLECFIKETLRLYPSVPGVSREAVRETKLANKLILPAGTQINIHIFDIHRNPKYFEKPEVFDPERFTPENSAGRHPFAYVPFSAGQRNCIGQKFAMLEMKTLIVYVLKNFKILPRTDPKDFAFEVGIIIRAENDVRVQLVKRN